MRWSVLTTKALSLPFRPQDGSKWRCVCLELDYRRTITFSHGNGTQEVKSQICTAVLNSVHCLRHRRFGAAGRVAAIDTTTPAANVVFRILAEFERELISERTDGGASARARGRKGGRKPKMEPIKLRLAKSAMAKRKTAVVDLCGALGITSPTLYRHVAAAATSVPHRGNQEIGKR